MADRPYVRIYYGDLIRDYQGVWEDDLQLAAFVRLLATADPMWPTPPELPRSLKQKALERLTESGLVILIGQRFRMKGLDTERNARAERGRPGAAVRWQNERNATALPTHGEGNASRARAEPSRSLDLAEPNARDEEPEWDAVTWLARHGCDVRPGNGFHRQLVTLTERFGVAAVIGMFDRLHAAGTEDGDVQGFVFGAKDALFSPSRPRLTEVDAEDRDKERRSAQSKRLEATQIRIHENGAHVDEPNPSCPRCKAVSV